MKTKILCPNTLSTTYLSILSFVLRLVVGGSMLTHGIAKLQAFDALSTTFPDPLGVGSMLSLLLALGAEVGCSVLIILGLFTRLATLPAMFTMGMAFLVIHSGDPFAIKELALMYFMLYLTIFVLGSGRYSLDKIFCKRR